MLPVQRVSREPVMHERDLRTLLLVRAIEDTDTAGTLLPLADREAATRETLRAARGKDVLGSDGTLTADGRHMLVERARRLADGLAQRHPALATLLTRPLTKHWSLSLLPLLALAVGLSLSALDDSRRINIIAFPLVGLVLWNFAVYLFLLVSRLRGTLPGGGLVAALVDRVRRRRLSQLRTRVGKVDAPLATALEQFTRAWWPATRPVLSAAARRLLHVGAAWVAVGLIAGMYVRGLVFRYEAGWESTFLGAEGVGTLLRVIYGPAAALSGIELPATAAQVAALEWRPPSPGVVAAPWIHVIALTAILYVVVPRLVLAAVSRLVEAKRVRSMTLPAGLAPYARRALGAAGGHTSGLAVALAAYAYELDTPRRNGLTRLVRQALGPESRIENETVIRYGEEDEYAAALRDDPPTLSGCLLGVMTLAATPEPENHGIVLTAWRDRVATARGTARLLFVVDEGPYLERLGGDASLAPRLDERRELWRSFASASGVPVLFANLAAVSREPAENAAAISALHGTLWPVEAAR